jgi:hypothetical protein
MLKRQDHRTRLRARPGQALQDSVSLASPSDTYLLRSDEIVPDIAILGLQGRSAILGMVQQRLEGLMGQSSGYIESLPNGTKKRVLALKGVQSDYEDLQLKYKKECLELEIKVRIQSHTSITNRFASLPR